MVVQAIPAGSTTAAETAVDWDALAARARGLRRTKAVALYAFLIAVSLPIILPYFWLVTIAFSAKTGVAETAVLWRSMAVVVPTVDALWLAAACSRKTGDRSGLGMVAVVASSPRSRSPCWSGPICTSATSSSCGSRTSPRWCARAIGEVKGAVQFPNVWHAFGNSILIAGTQTAIVVTVASLAAYYLSRFQFPGRARRCCARSWCCMPSRC